MDKDEDQMAASVMSELLASAILQAYNDGENPRLFLYVWERKAFRWLVRFHERNPHGLINMWTKHFIDLNRKAILSTDGQMDFNLKAADEKKAAN